MTAYLKAADEAALYAALEAAGLVTPDADAVVEGRAGYRHNVFLSVIGAIEGVEGYHANVFEPISDEQKAMLPWIPAPNNPVRVKAGD